MFAAMNSAGSLPRFSTQCERGPNSANTWPARNASIIPSL
jgi:hypothetical protein